MEMGSGFIIIRLRSLQDFQDYLGVFMGFRLKIFQDPAGFLMLCRDGSGIFGYQVE